MALPTKISTNLEPNFSCCKITFFLARESLCFVRLKRELRSSTRCSSFSSIFPATLGSFVLAASDPNKLASSLDRYSSDDE